MFPVAGPIILKATLARIGYSYQLGVAPTLEGASILADGTRGLTITRVTFREIWGFPVLICSSQRVRIEDGGIFVAYGATDGLFELTEILRGTELPIQELLEFLQKAEEEYEQQISVQRNQGGGGGGGSAQQQELAEIRGRILERLERLLPVVQGTGSVYETDLFGPLVEGILGRASRPEPFGVRVIGAYFPNGQAPDSEKFVYKMRWQEALQEAHKVAQQFPTDEQAHNLPQWVEEGDRSRGGPTAGP